MWSQLYYDVIVNTICVKVKSTGKPNKTYDNKTYYNLL